MKILAELAPVRKRSYLEFFIASTRDYVDCYDIPESPLGYPAPNAIATGVYVKELSRKCVLSHIRLYDINTNGLLSLAYAAYTYDVDGIVLTHGDKPRYGSIVRDIDTEKAIALLKKEIPDLRIGAIISLRYPINEIARRISIGADFFLVLRLGENTIDKYMEVVELAKENSVELYPYIIVSTDKNRDLLAKLNQPTISLDKIGLFIRECRHLLHGALFSCPHDFNGLIRSLEKAYEVRLVSQKSLQQQQCFQASL